MTKKFLLETTKLGFTISENKELELGMKFLEIAKGERVSGNQPSVAAGGVVCEKPLDQRPKGKMSDDDWGNKFVDIALGVNPERSGIIESFDGAKKTLGSFKNK